MVCCCPTVFLASIIDIWKIIMKSIIFIIGLLLISFFGLCAQPNAGFAQENTAESDWSEKTIVVPEDWEHDSALYRGWGWGLFGTGLALAGARTALLIVDVVTGIFLVPVGALMVIPGVGLLIADAVKFNKYRDAETGFSWQPNTYVSPQMTGFGVSGRF